MVDNNPSTLSMCSHKYYPRLKLDYILWFPVFAL